MDDELLALIEEWRLELRSRHCAPSTIRSYLGAMEAFAAFLNKESRSQEVASIAASDIDAFLRDVARREALQDPARLLAVDAGRG
jgi:site-specific recombinase XerD